MFVYPSLNEGVKSLLDRIFFYIREEGFSQMKWQMKGRSLFRLYFSMSAFGRKPTLIPPDIKSPVEIELGYFDSPHETPPLKKNFLKKYFREMNWEKSRLSGIHLA